MLKTDREEKQIVGESILIYTNIKKLVGVSDAGGITFLSSTLSLSPRPPSKLLPVGGQNNTVDELAILFPLHRKLFSYAVSHLKEENFKHIFAISLSKTRGYLTGQSPRNSCKPYITISSSLSANFSLFSSEKREES